MLCDVAVYVWLQRWRCDERYRKSAIYCGFYRCWGEHILSRNTPFQMAFVQGYCNGIYDYIPSEIAYTHGCYEMDHGYFVKGTGEELADLYVKMLKDLHG